jgi:Uma2 family endonuclease
MYAAPPEESIPMTEAEYLAFEATSEFKHEYSRGRIYAMTGGSVRHGVITANTIIHLGNQLSERNCSVTSPDVRIYIASKSAYRYPDVMVFCGDPAYMRGRTDTIMNPVVLVEVLSPSTVLLDRNDKLMEYTLIETLQAYLLVSQHEPRIERYMRHESGEWLYSITNGLESEIALPAIDCTLALSKVYQKVTFDQSESNNDR